MTTPRPKADPLVETGERLLARYHRTLRDHDQARVNLGNARALLRIAERNRDEARTALELHLDPARGMR